MPRAPKKATPIARTMPEAASTLSEVASSYRRTSPLHIKLIDAFLLFLFVTGVAQFAYCVLLSDFPFNSFLSGFAATVGQFVLALALRMQSDLRTKNAGSVSPQRSFAEFVFASIVLHFTVVNFLG
ncbi:oligosaccharyltransferase complex subunit epsilon [Malassezia sp. CBS 17886]|nr:oligosaccharyltransferase complex subunit epsilon [Malassezia sp. CBS 17886]